MSSATETVLCDTCKNLLSGVKDVRKWNSSESPPHFIFHLELGTLRGSSQFCRLCKLLLDGLKSAMRGYQTEPHWLDNLKAISGARMEVPYWDNGYEIHFKYQGLPGVDVFMIQENAPVRNMEHLFHLRKSHRRVEGNTSSDSSLELVKAWIDNCLTNHPKCNRKISPRTLPTRLVEIGENLLLRTSADLPPNTLYTTLSHRWGNFEIPRLIKSLYVTFSGASIPLSELPLTYQHAISYTKRLGIRYIWIDSLCIIQDSKEDWLKEADRMSEVYSNSYCNIAATASEDGLFRDRDPASVSACRVRPTWNGLDRGSFYCGDKSDWREVVNQPLCKRGWVVQERALAPRVLHFGAYQLYFECRQATASEMWPEGMTNSFRGRFNKEDMNFPSGDNLDNAQSCYHSWRFCVEYFSSCQLTYKSDKLVAISGIARVIYDSLGGKDIYLAGLWKEDLVIQLLWWVQADAEPATRVVPFRAPSWSWASLDTRVKFQGSRVETATHLTRVLDATTSLAGDSPFGQVVSGVIQLSGPLFRVHLSLAEDKSDRISVTARPIGVPSGSLVMEVYPDENITRTTNLDLNIHCIMLLRFLPNASNSVDGLLLQPTKGKTVYGSERNHNGEFTRFGRFSGVGHDEWAKFVQGEPKIVDLELEFASNNRDGTYVITLI